MHATTKHRPQAVPMAPRLQAFTGRDIDAAEARDALERGIKYAVPVWVGVGVAVWWGPKLLAWLGLL